MIQAGASEPGLDLAARTADVVFTVVQDLEEAKAGYAALKARLPRFGRRPEEVTVLPGVMPIVGRTRQEARDLLDRLQSFVTSTNAASLLSSRLGVDVSGFPPDERVPDLPLPETSHGFARAMLSKARREEMTWRDLLNLTGAARGHWVVAGTAADIADTLQEWFEGGAADGFNVMPAWFPGAFDDIVDQVVPELQRRGLFRTQYAATTLRGHLGLPEPENRFFPKG
jgi:alkanesulfonate monooxygenase SsuD/methylene tetrahydromethanopterin reductase-like flavin-dependent oxidoreductase (luciferase family)